MTANARVGGGGGGKQFYLFFSRAGALVWLIFGEKMKRLWTDYVSLNFLWAEKGLFAVKSKNTRETNVFVRQKSTNVERILGKKKSPIKVGRSVQTVSTGFGFFENRKSRLEVGQKFDRIQT